MSSTSKRFAEITGASTGIGYELARVVPGTGMTLLICADEPEIFSAADRLRTDATSVAAVNADLATVEGVEQLYGANEDAADSGRALAHGPLSGSCRGHWGEKVRSRDR